MDTGFFLKYQVLAKLCQAPWITVPRNSETWTIFLKKLNQIPKFCVILICSVCVGIFQLKIIFLLRTFSPLLKKKANPPKTNKGGGGGGGEGNPFECWY